MTYPLPLRRPVQAGAALMLLAALFLAACAASPPLPPPPPPSPPPTASIPAGEATPLPIADRPPTATATASPTATPSPTPTPTSTPPPLELLATAARLLRHGDTGGAAAAYQELRDRQLPPAEAAAAAFGLGQALWADGQSAAAVVAFAAAAADPAFVAAHPELLYWLGRSYSAVGQDAAAIPLFETFAERRPLVAAWAHHAAGDAAAAALNPGLAGAYYRQALTAAPDLPTALRAREGIAAAAVAAGDLAAARVQYDAILAAAQNAGYRAEILYLRGQALEAESDLAAAWQSYAQALRSAPASSYAYLALLALVNAGQQVDDLLAGQVYLAAGAQQTAIAALYRYLDAHPAHDGEAHLLAAQAYEGLGNYDAAAVEWRKIIDTHPGDSRVGEAWLGLARGRWRQNDPAAARALYLQAADARPDPQSAGDALWWAGVLAERDPVALDDAAAIFQRLSDSYPRHERSQEAAFRAGLSLYQAGDLAQARQRWQALAASGADFWHAAAAYWAGKALHAQDEGAAAQAQWQETAQRWGQGNYYGLRAAQQIQAAAAPANGPLPTPGPTAAAADLAIWLAIWLPLDAPPDLTSLPTELTRAAHLHAMGEYAAVRSAFETLRTRWQDDAVALARLALHTAELGYYDTSIRAAARVQTLSDRGLAQTPRALQTLIYPIYYDDLILPAAAANDLEPALFFALIRQESLFGAGAASPAAARGLAQIIPSTGRAIAERLNWPNYSTELLYRPYVNVAFGAHYLAEGMQAAGGNVLQALAGYNGGPGNAAFWRRQAGADDDLYVELVSFEETKTYLRAITVQAQHYRRLYPRLAEAN